MITCSMHTSPEKVEFDFSLSHTTSKSQPYLVLEITGADGMCYAQQNIFVKQAMFTPVKSNKIQLEDLKAVLESLKKETQKAIEEVVDCIEGEDS